MPEEPIDLRCPNCQMAYRLDSTMAGRKAQCGDCGHRFVVPGVAATGDGFPPAGESGPSSAASIHLTVEDAQRLWKGSISPGANPLHSIKPSPLLPETRSQRPDLILRPYTIRGAGRPPGDGPGDSDFELYEELGRGGMGVVHRARQAAVDREVAIKVIRPDLAGDEAVRSRFLDEAVATGELEHPNIVPLYTVGTGPDGLPFYAMKEVKGTAWNAAISENALDENLDILLKVCDAVAFAHDKGIIHRDLKPENVMLGEYGEVMVMDWGLAVAVRDDGKAEALTTDSRRAGTPAYMAPEMARCEAPLIGPASDVYLLGGILYEIVTGLKPHAADNVYACIYAAMENRIQATRESGELIEIAMKAMAADPADRHASVKEFQEAIRMYRKHTESVSLSTRAAEHFAYARASGDYRTYAKAALDFEEALQLWSGNAAAERGFAEANAAYARCAYEKGDLDLAAALLEAQSAEHAQLAEQVRHAQEARTLRRRRLRTLTVGSAVLVAAVLAVLAAALCWVRVAYARADTARLRTGRENYCNTVGLIDSELSRGAVTRQCEELLWATSPENRNWEWGRLLYGCHQDLLRFRAHSLGIWAVAFAPDGTRFATASTDGTAKVWDTDSGELLLELAPGGFVTRAVFSPDGKLVATGARDSKVRLWSSSDGRQIACFALPAGVKPSVLAFLPSDPPMLVCGGGDAAGLFEPETGKVIRLFRGHTDDVKGLAVSADGTRLVTTGEDRTARIWDVASGREVVKLAGDGCRFGAAAFAPDGERVATAVDESAVVVWDAEEGTRVLELAENASIWSIMFSGDGRRILTGSCKVAKLWDAVSGRELRVFPRRGWAVFSPTEDRVVTAGWDGHGGCVQVWDMSRGGDTALPRLLCTASSAWLSAEAGRVVTQAPGGTLSVWDTGTAQELSVFDPGQAGTSVKALSADGARLALTGADKKRVGILDATTGDTVGSFTLHRPAGLCAAFSPTRDRLAIATGRVAGIWDTANGREVAQLVGHSHCVRSVVFSPDGRLVATGSGFQDRSVRIWDAKTGRQLKRLEGHRFGVCGLAFSPNGELLASGSGDWSVRVWNVASGRARCVLEGHTWGVSSLAFSPDGSRLLTSGGKDRTVRLWDTSTGHAVLTLSHESDLASVAFSPDGKRVVTITRSGALRWFDALDWTMSREQLKAYKRARYRKWIEDHR